METKVAYAVVPALILAACAAPAPSEGEAARGGARPAPVVVEQAVLERAGGGAIAAGEPGTAEVIGGDEEALREFLGRYISPLYPGAPGGVTQVLIGSLPDDLPFDIPQPEDARIIGSVVRPESFRGIEILLEADMPPEEVATFYDEELTDAGWRAAAMFGPVGGFVSQPMAESNYCHDDQDAAVSVIAFASDTGASDIRLHVQTPLDDYSFCSEEQFGGPEGYELIPELVAPVGVVMRSSGGGSGGGEQYISASLETELAVEELAAHYVAQLEDADWQQIDDGASDGIVWSTWSLTDEDGDEWNGLLFVLESAGASGQRFAWLRIERVA